MPHHKSCKKRILTSEKSKIRNRQIKSRIKTATKNLLNAKDKDSVDTAIKTVYSVLDKAVKSRVIHKKNAANKKSHLSKSKLKTTT
jgi:small subunit ribosomal protein S20